MAVFSELYQDWDKLPPAGRVIVVAGVAGVALLGVNAFRNRKASGSSTIGLPSDTGYGSFTVPGGPSSATGGSTGTTSGGPVLIGKPIFGDRPPVHVPSPPTTAAPAPRPKPAPAPVLPLYQQLAIAAHPVRSRTQGF